MPFELWGAAFIAGILTFLAPCTLPLVPGYLGFISGVSAADLRSAKRLSRLRARVLGNGFLYVLGFSGVFVLLGSAVGWAGGTVLVQYRHLAMQIGGVFVVLFGVLMMYSALLFYEAQWPGLGKVRLRSLDWLLQERHWSHMHGLQPGHPLSSLLFGAVFAVGWTPCVGPVLGSILTLAATSMGAGAGAVLLLIFSLGLGMPFLVLAAGVGYFSQRLPVIMRWLPPISFLGGVFITLLGVLVMTNQLGIWTQIFFEWFSFLRYEERLLRFL